MAAATPWQWRQRGSHKLQHVTLVKLMTIYQPATRIETRGSDAFVAVCFAVFSFSSHYLRESRQGCHDR